MRLVKIQILLAVVLAILGQFSYAQTNYSITKWHCHYEKKHIQGMQDKIVKVCVKKPTFREKMDQFLSSLTPSQESVVQERVKAEEQVNQTPFALTLFEPTYVLPFYYTGRPYQSVYQGNTPNNQPLMQEEFKGQMSFKFTLWHHIFRGPLDLNVSYTQLSFWQVYTNSQFFRETDYEPALFLSDNFLKNWLAYLGVVHQSNGRGGQLERSWNRVFGFLMASGRHWFVGIEPWILIFQKDSSDLHNPDIANYLGYGQAIFAFTFYHQELSFMFRNTVESGFKRGAIQIGYSIPIYSKIRFYFQFFTGYGQSLIEYNHYTNGVGVGIALNDWI